MKEMEKPPCPRHGRDGKIDLGPRIRCDCLDTIYAGVGALKRGKWISGGEVGRALCDIQAGPAIVDELQTRGDRAVDEALLAGYMLGLRGGVEPGRVVTCTGGCSRPFVRVEPVRPQVDTGTECLSCWLKNNPKCF